MMGIVNTLAVWPDNANVEFLCRFHHLILEYLAFVTGFTEAAGNDHCAFYTCFTAFLNRLGYKSGRNNDNCQIRCFCNILDAFVTGKIENGIGFRINRINSTIKSAVYDVFQNFIAYFIRAVEAPIIATLLGLRIASNWLTGSATAMAYPLIFFDRITG